MRHSRRGFTLIELLVVIGIIMILVGLLVVGYRHINATTARRETIAELHICRGMQQEYENRNGLQGIEFLATAQTPDPSGPKVTSLSPLPLTPGFPVFLDPYASLNTMNSSSQSTNQATYSGSGSGNLGSTWPCLTPTDIETGTAAPYISDMGDKTDSTSPRYFSNAVGYTDEVMYVLGQIPANRTTMQALQSKRILELPPGQTQWLSQSGPPMSFPPVVPLDGWGNPIIFVPRGGMHVTIQDPASTTSKPLPPMVYLVRSTGTTLVKAGSPDPPMTGNERPFWASAGQDGDFTLGEDNVYSFQD